MKTKPDLGIKNPYALDQKQFDAAVDLLKTQQPIIGEYWADYAEEIQRLRVRQRSCSARRWQFNANLDQRRRRSTVEHDRAQGGRDRLVGHLDDRRRTPSTRTACTSGWTGSSRRRSTPRSPSGSARRRRRRRRATQTADKNFCTTYHAADADYAGQDLVLDDADQGLPRRPRRRLHRLRRLDARPGPGSRADDAAPTAVRRRAAPPGRAAQASRRRRRTAHPRLRLGGAALGADGLARRRLPRLAGGHVRGGVLEHRHVHRRRWSRSSRWRTSESS